MILGAIALLIFVIASSSVLLMNPPPLLVRGMMLVGSRHLLTSDGELSCLTPLQRLLSTYIEFALAQRMAARVAQHADGDDVARIDYALRRVQLRVLNANQIPHAARPWPTLLAGFGYCDQVNAVACEVLAHSFPKTELYALYDPQQKVSPHTIGRAWSPRRREWLYFDAFCDRPIVFRRVAGGGIEVLNAAAVSYPTRGQPDFSTYKLKGWVINKYSATYSKYLTRKMYAAIFNEDATAAPPDLQGVPVNAGQAGPPTQTAAGMGQPEAMDTHDRAVFARIADVYLRARAEDILGERDQARAIYRSVVSERNGIRDSDAVLLQSAAHEFARQ